jgi:hypothetical protein
VFKVRRAAWIAVSLLAPAACFHANHAKNLGPSPAATASPHAVASGAAAAAKPAAPPTTVAPSPAAGVSASPTPLSAALPPPPKKVPRKPPNAAPQILDVAVSETTVHPGDRVYGRVVTSSNVASVEARIGGYAMSLVKTGVGRFELTYTVGPLPWFVRGNFTMQVIARNTRGDAVTRAIPLTVR